MNSADRAEKTALLGLPRARLEDYFASLGESPFRARQLLKWVHHHAVTDFSQMTDFSTRLRVRLAELADIRPPPFSQQQQSADGSCKWLLPVADGAVETVFIPDGARGTLCVSSQVGCSLNCAFCATGRQGFQSNLSAEDIIGQVWRAHESLAAFLPGKNRRITNIVLMGMGEPLLNFDSTVAATDIMMDDFAYGIPGRRVTVSTAGVAPAIVRLARVSRAALAVSLHAPDDSLRNELVPLNRKYPLADLLQACREYLAILDNRRRVVTFEYTLLAGVNDSPAQARDTVRLLRGLPCKVNLIPFNPFPGAPYRRPAPAATAAFQEQLRRAGYIVTVRTTRGEDIEAACGQLRGRVADRTRRSLRLAAAAG